MCAWQRGREQRCEGREGKVFVIFISEVGFRGKWNVGMNEIRFVFRFMNPDNRVAFV